MAVRKPTLDDLCLSVARLLNQLLQAEPDVLDDLLAKYIRHRGLEDPLVHLIQRELTDKLSRRVR